MKEDFHPDFIFGVALSTGKSKPSNNPYNQIETMIMQETNYEVDEEDGMIIRFNMPDVSLLDFQKANEIMEMGYKRTMSLIDSIKGRVHRKMPLDSLNLRRKQYKESLPPLVFKNIYITGVSESQQKYIESQLHRDINQEFSMEEFKRAYFKMLAYSKIKEIVPKAIYNRVNKTFDLHLYITMSDEINIGLGGNISSHQANQLYLGLGYRYLGRYAADMNADFQVGNSFSGVMLNGRMYLQTRIPTYINWQGVFSYKRYSESQSLFYEDVVPAFIKQHELYMKLKLGFPFLNRAKAEIGFGYGQLNDYYYQNTEVSFADRDYEHSRYNLFSGSLNIEQNSLSTKVYPISGVKRSLNAQYITGTEKYKPNVATEPTKNNTHSWLQMKAHWEQYHELSKLFNLGYTGELVLSSKNLMENYTASILQAPAFTPTPHSTIVFNEAFRANQYAALGISPILKLGKFVHFRLDLYGFLPLYEIKKHTEVLDNNYVMTLPYYGKFLDSFKYMGEAAFVVHLPFTSISLYANGYSYPSKNFNFGINIGYLLFNPKLLD